MDCKSPKDCFNSLSVLTDAHGNPTQTTVSDWLHTDTPETYIQDKSDLTDIENVKSDSQPTLKDGCLLWNMPTTDLYYKGTSDKPLPVSSLGSIEMPKSVGELKKTLNQLKDLERAMQTLDPQNVLGQLMQEPEKISALTGMVTDAMQVYKSNEKLLSVLSKYMTEENVRALQNISGANTGSASLGELVRLLSDPEVQQFLRLMPAASGDLVKLLPMLQGLSEDLRDPEIQKELENLPQTVEQINELQNGLEENRALINALATLADAEKMQKLTDILNASDGADFAEKLTEYGVLAEDADGLLNRMAEMLSFGNQFKIYSDAADGTQTSVMFVYKTPPIRKNTEVSEQPTEVQENWFRRVFGKH